MNRPSFGAKKAAITGASGRSAASFARAKLTELLDFIGVDMISTQVGMAITPEEFETDELVLSDSTKVGTKEPGPDILDLFGLITRFLGARTGHAPFFIYRGGLP